MHLHRPYRGGSTSVPGHHGLHPAAPDSTRGYNPAPLPYLPYGKISGAKIRSADTVTGPLEGSLGDRLANRRSGWYTHA